MSIQIGFKRFRENAKMPTKSTDLANGWDLYACIPNNGDKTIQPHETVIINTGLNIELPLGWYAYIQSRSGLAAKSSLNVLNSPGLIDVDFSGNFEDFELKIILHNHSNILTQKVKDGDRLAQITFHQVPDVKVVELDRDVIPHKSNRLGGLGHTGV